MLKLDTSCLVIEAKKTKMVKPSLANAAKLAFLVIGTAIAYIGCAALATRLILHESVAVLKEYTFLSFLEKLNGTPDGFLFYLFTTVLMILFSIGFCLLIEKRSLLSMGFTKKKFSLYYFIGYCIGAVLLAVCVVGTYVFGGTTIEKVKSIQWAGILCFFVGYCIQGLAEEVVIHGLLMMSLMNRTRPVVAIVFSSLFFTLFHFFNPGYGIWPFLNLFLFGLFEGLLMIRMDSIWGAAAMHSAWNFFQGNIFGIKVSGSVLTPTIFSVSNINGKSMVNGGSFGIEGSIITTMVFAVAIAVLIFTTGERQIHKAK